MRKKVTKTCGKELKESRIGVKNDADVAVVYDWKHLANEKAGREGIVWVRVYKKGKRSYVSTGVKVLPSQWSDKYWVVKRRDADALNRIIQEQADKCAEMMRQCTDEKRFSVTAKMMRVDRSDASFLDWMRKEIEDCRLASGTKKHHLATLARLEEWGKMKRFDDVTPQRIREYIRWVERRGMNKVTADGVENLPIEQVTVYDHFKRLRKWINLAIGERLVNRDAMDGVKVTRGKSKPREHLSDGELAAIERVALPNEHLRNARDRFLVQCGTGVSYSDLMSIDWTKRRQFGGHTVVAGRRVKTGEDFFLVVLPIAERVLERWEWKVPKICYNDYNAFIGVVAHAAGIDKHVTTHVGRHTYATQCLSHGVRIEAVQRALGHSDIRTTQIYAKMVDKAVVDAFDKWN